MIEAVRVVRNKGSQRPVCVVVHGLFSDAADEALLAEGAEIITSNAVPHATNRIDVAPFLVDPVKRMLDS